MIQTAYTMLRIKGWSLELEIFNHPFNSKLIPLNKPIQSKSTYLWSQRLHENGRSVECFHLMCDLSIDGFIHVMSHLGHL